MKIGLKSELPPAGCQTPEHFLVNDRVRTTRPLRPFVLLITAAAKLAIFVPELESPDHPHVRRGRQQSGYPPAACCATFPEAFANADMPGLKGVSSKPLRGGRYGIGAYRHCRTSSKVCIGVTLGAEMDVAIANPPCFAFLQQIPCNHQLAIEIP